MKKSNYVRLQLNEEKRTADVFIYGDITSAAGLYRNWGMDEGEASAVDVKDAIAGLDVDEINVYINSYGGEVSEALAMCALLKRHQAKIHTYCDGFACSAATIVFCAGDIRTMDSGALFMIHNCMSYLGYANSNEMRKAAEDNDKINQSSIDAYKAVTGLDEEKIKEMMDAETWLSAKDCLEMGFATEIAESDDDTPQQSALALIAKAVLQKQESDPEDLDDQEQTDEPSEEEESEGEEPEEESEEDDNDAEQKSGMEFLSKLFMNLV